MDAIGDLLAALERRLSRGSRLAAGRAGVLLEDSWESVAGEHAAYTSPIGLSGGTLFVAVDCAARAHMLAFQAKGELVERARAVVGGDVVHDVVFRVVGSRRPSDS